MEAPVSFIFSIYVFWPYQPTDGSWHPSEGVWVLAVAGLLGESNLSAVLHPSSKGGEWTKEEDESHCVAGMKPLQQSFIWWRVLEERLR